MSIASVRLHAAILPADYAPGTPVNTPVASDATKAVEFARLRLWSASEFMRLLDICRATFYKHIREGRIPAGHKFGGRVIWQTSEVEQVRARIFGGEFA